MQCAGKQPGLRLDPFDGGNDEHGAVEDFQDPFDLGDEVRVAGGVDEVDGGFADFEGDHGGFDGDAPRAFEREGVGPRGAVVDAAQPLDHPGGEQQPFGEAGFTGVDVRENSQVECGQ